MKAGSQSESRVATVTEAVSALPGWTVPQSWARSYRLLAYKSSLYFVFPSSILEEEKVAG